MDKDVRIKLEQIKDQIDELLNQEELTFVGTFEGKYELYLFPKSTEKHLNWYEAKECCKSLDAELPTISELQFIYDNNFNLTFEDHFYWSSIEGSSAKAYSYNFNNGSVRGSLKDAIAYVRPVKRCYT